MEDGTIGATLNRLFNKANSVNHYPSAVLFALIVYVRK